MHYPSTHLLTVFPLRARKEASIPATFRREAAYTPDKSPVYRTSNDEQPVTLTFTPEDSACLWTVGGSCYQERTHTDAGRTCRLLREMYFQVVLLMHITGQPHRGTYKHAKYTKRHRINGFKGFYCHCTGTVKLFSSSSGFRYTK